MARRRLLGAIVRGCASAGVHLSGLGGLTSFCTTWLTQQAQLAQLADKHREADSARRLESFNAFIVEASRLYGDALSHEKDDIGDMVQLYALTAKMRLWASRPVVAAAERAMSVIVQTYREGLANAKDDPTMMYHTSIPPFYYILHGQQDAPLYSKAISSLQAVTDFSSSGTLSGNPTIASPAFLVPATRIYYVS